MSTCAQSSTAVCLLTLSLAMSVMVGQVIAGFDIRVVAPNDPDFEFQLSKAAFPEVTEILSVTSPVPHLIMGDNSGGPKNQIFYKGSLPPCDIPLTVIGRKPDGSIVRYTGTINVNKVNPDDLKQATGIKGPRDKLDELIKDLKGTYTVDVVSSTSTPPHSTVEVGIVLRDKGTGKIIPGKETEKIVNDKVNNLPGGSGTVVPTKPDCFLTCKDLCSTVLTADTTTQVQTAFVVGESSKAYAGIPSKWTHLCGKDIFENGNTDICGPSTCANRGTCTDATKSSATGPSKAICTCPARSNEASGPRCELLTRSYLAPDASRTIITHHRVLLGYAQPQSMTFSFQHNGVCKQPGSLCSIVRIQVGSKELIKVELGRITEPRYTSATLPVSPIDANKMQLHSDRYVGSGRWMDVTVSVQLNSGQVKATAVFCSKEVNPVCMERTATKSVTGTLLLTDAEVSIGGAFNGCFRNVRLNGQIVDLEPVKVTGDRTLTQENCALQSASCGGDGSHVCGAKSLCYGQLGPKLPGMSCGCRCTESTRLTAERVTRPMQCASSCSKDAPIISTPSSAVTLSWAMQDGRAIRLDFNAPLSIEFRLRTRQSDASELVKLDGGGATLIVKIQGSVLFSCLNSNCYQFAPKPVTDGNWHHVFVRLAHSQLLTRVGGLGRVHSVSSVSVSEFRVSARVPSSCITGLRVSDIYMPTEDTDGTQDADGTAAVKLTVSGGSVKVGQTCEDPASPCACNSATEDCVSQWGLRTCDCKPGHKRLSSGGSCQLPAAAGDPCKRLSIACPNAGGQCKEVGGKWQVCV